MEKSRYCSKLPSYDEFQAQRQDSEGILESIGFGFASGTVGGLLYHLYKFKADGINQKLHPKALRVGGIVALLSIYSELSMLAVRHLSGNSGKEKAMEAITCSAASAALMWSPHGLRSALVAGGLASALTCTVLYRELDKPSMSKINAYSYHHYRP